MNFRRHSSAARLARGRKSTAILDRIGPASTWEFGEARFFMEKFVIRGGNPLVGTVRISGAKNAALPAMAAALLTDATVVLENIPDVRDIQTMRKLLVEMGGEVELGYGRAHHRTTIRCR